MLPEELIVHIFSFLSATNLATAQRVCKHWRKIAEEDSLWQRHHQRRLGCKPLMRIFSKRVPYSFKQSYLIYCKNEAECIRFKEMLAFSHDENLAFEHQLLEHYISKK
ncbi:hypothetical protein DB41_CX00110 [Neochlamydia sp. TUME1]|uniref:F-box protein n=1 Tax=Neochlamydia sp. TUME1 TaxID=1478174 RepID=UPI000583F60D|nr:F-box protein [Neochlamydia sp. TUME1]KIC77145.1 hypothetical protein DB41_CX00110 [Neochlamydia sp. TUME1]